MDELVVVFGELENIDMWETLRDYAIKQPYPLDMKMSEVMRITGMTKQDYIDNFDTIYRALYLIEHEKKS